MNGFFAITAVIAAIVIALACWPLLRGKQLVPGVVTVVLGAGVGVAVYLSTSNFDSAKPDRVPSVAEQLAELRQLAEARPEECAGWRRLGSGLLLAGDSAGAVSAYEKAYAVCDKTDADLLLDYAEALAENDRSSIVGQAGHLIENALTLAPNNLRALWYGGSVAAARGNRELAAARFETMLRPDTPPRVREILESNIQALRGEATAQAVAAADSGKSITVDIDVAESVGPLSPSATLFVIATTEQGGPPLGVVRTSVAKIKDPITIGDENAMIPGRNISSQSQVRLIARVSNSGQPAAQPGDRFGQLDIDVASTNAVSITIDQIVK
ncbi:MAG: hypothetical protein AAFX44_11790 [Pseudomonadota bacterium]